MAKYGHVREGGKVGRSDATPTNFFSVDSNNLKSMSFKFGNDIFITFEMPGVAYSMSFDKIHISLQFRPSVIRGPCITSQKLYLSLPLKLSLYFKLYDFQKSTVEEKIGQS